MDNNSCYHCGDLCQDTTIVFDKKNFCCHGCKTVYDLMKSNDLLYYYELNDAAGASPQEFRNKYDFLENPKIASQLLEFDQGQVQVAQFHIPHIHCSSCIWVLENLHKIHPGVRHAQVNFPKKKVRITYSSHLITLRALVELLARIGYEPRIALDAAEQKEKKADHSLVLKIGVAGFAFGNIMFLSFPEYFDLYGSQGAEADPWFVYYKDVFRWIMMALSVPVVFYASRDYFISAYRGIRSKLLNIDVPIALGILVLFVRSCVEVLFDLGSGFFDSLSGLVFFLLVGKYFQGKTYDFLSFERDYRSYFPLAVTRITDHSREESIPIYEAVKGDRLVLRHGELIPVDCRMEHGKAWIDYSFVTGESRPVEVEKGDKIFAGGKQMAGRIEVQVLKPVNQSYLTQLWEHSVFKEDKVSKFQNLTDRVGKHFTLVVLSIAAVATAYWIYMDPSKALNVFTAVLIIACPCALALSAPFALGTLMRIFGRLKFYLKNTQTIERLARINTAIFDKTGTLTSQLEPEIHYSGISLTGDEEALLKNTLHASNHPLSRSLRKILADHDIRTLERFEEVQGSGVSGTLDGKNIKAGKAEYVNPEGTEPSDETQVHISADSDYKGYYSFRNTYRNGIQELMKELKSRVELAVLSGDNAGERPRLEKILPSLTPVYFDQKPEDKLRFISRIQDQHKTVLMVGDGLNDAGALAQSDVGIAVTEDANVFSPACDAIIDAGKLKYLGRYMKASRHTMQIVRMSFALSLLYNIIGIYFAVTGQLVPVIAAILMPLSSISVVSFVTLATRWATRKLE